jgi:hypothetical protein
VPALDLRQRSEENTDMSQRTSRQGAPRQHGVPRRGGQVAGLIVGLALAVVVATGVAGAATAPTPPTAASGTLAALSGTSIEVQNPTSGQVTVNWSPTTTFSQTVTVPSSTVAVGDCVTATGAAPTTKTSAKTKTGSIKATTVSISQPSSSGTCSGFGGAAFGGGAGGFRPTGGAGGSSTFRPPTGTFPKGGTFAGRGVGALANVAFGKVTSISGDVLVVVGTRPTFTSSTKGKTSKTTKPAKPAKPAKPKLTKTTSKVTFATSTTFSETMSATSAALAVGQCVTALGPAGTTGAITATTISVRPAPSTGCVSFTGGGGFGGRFGGGIGRGAGAGGARGATPA